MEILGPIEMQACDIDLETHLMLRYRYDPEAPILQHQVISVHYLSAVAETDNIAEAAVTEKMPSPWRPS